MKANIRSAQQSLASCQKSKRWHNASDLQILSVQGEGFLLWGVVAFLFAARIIEPISSLTLKLILTPVCLVPCIFIIWHSRRLARVRDILIQSGHQYIADMQTNSASDMTNPEGVAEYSPGCEPGG